jgi:hypothetical protein
MRIAASLVLASAALLAGCAHPWYTMNLPPGTPRDEIIAKAGPPIRVVPMPEGGQRLQYTLMPLGHYAFMVDLDATSTPAAAWSRRAR